MQQFRSVPPNIAFAIIAGILIGMGGVPVAADQTGVAPPEGSALLLEVLADGVQIYTCEAKGNRFEWSFKAPEANLFDKQGRQIGTHFAGPTWKMADGSAIVGEVAAKADAPEKDAIQWLLLRAKAMKGKVSLRKLPLFAGRRPWAASRRQPVATQATFQSRRACATRPFISSSARQSGK